MSNNIFFCSDHHIDHANILTFKNADGTMVREFRDLEHMQEVIINNHNSVVRPQDKVYFCGDVVMHKRNLPILKRMNGHKRLVRGNHDIHPIEEYLKYFDEVYGVRVFSKENFVVSHVPLHPDCLQRKSWNYNVHGHLHNNQIHREYPANFIEPDSKYINVCMERINFTPVEMSEILDEIGK